MMKIADPRSVWNGTRSRILMALLVTATTTLVISLSIMTVVGGDIATTGPQVLAILVAVTGFSGIVLACALGTEALHGRINRLLPSSCEPGHEGIGSMAQTDGHPLAGAPRRTDSRLAGRVQAQMAEITDPRYRILKSHEAFRRELASELHGPIQTRLLLLSHRLNQIQKARAGHASTVPREEELLDEIQHEVTEVRERLREVSHRLYPALDSLGLIPALRSLVERFEGHVPVTLRVESDSGLETNLGCGNGDLSLGISKEATIGIYRSVEEALCNVVKHADAGSVTVDIKRQAPNTLVIMVRDDGKGFDPAEKWDGIGLGMVRDYIGAFGGSLYIESGPGRGATVQLVVPLSPPGPEVVQAATREAAVATRWRRRPIRSLCTQPRKGPECHQSTERVHSIDTATNVKIPL